MRVLVRFIRSDGSPSSKRFFTGVAESADCPTAFLGKFVRVKLDHPTPMPPRKVLRSHTVERCECCKVTTYPARIIADPDGTLAASQVPNGRAQRGRGGRDVGVGVGQRGGADRWSVGIAGFSPDGLRGQLRALTERDRMRALSRES